MNDDTKTESPLTKGDLIDQRIDKVFKTPPTVQIGAHGALAYADMGQVIEAAKMMSMSGAMIPPWLQGNPGACWAIIVQASHWGFEPVAVARMAYEVTDKEGRKQVAYMSQLQHALIEARAPLRHRLRFAYEGQGEARVCTCTGHLRGEVDPLEYVSPPLSKITPKRSPLWSSDPDQQLAYYSSRAWARRYCPDILMGVYGDDEELGTRAPASSRAIDVTDAADSLRERLAAAKATAEQPGADVPEGFAASIADGHPTAEPSAAPGVAETLPEPPRAQEPEQSNQRPPPGRETATPKVAKPAKLPTTPEAYRRYVAGWLKEAATEQAVEERWRGERKLRNAAGVVEEDRNKVRLLVEQRIAELRS